MTHAAAFDAFLALRFRTPSHASKLVWVYIAPMLNDETARALSASAIARALDTKFTTVRRALEHLEAVGLVTCTQRPQKTLPGHYRLGPATRGVGERSRDIGGSAFWHQAQDARARFHDRSAGHSTQAAHAAF